MNNDDNINIAWVWEWHWYRQSLVEDALEFAALAGDLQRAELVALLTELGAAGLRSASRLSAAMSEAEVPHVRILRPLQWFFRRHIDAPEGVIERLAFARVVQWRLARRMGEAIEDLPPVVAVAAKEALAGCRQTMDVLSSLLDGNPSAEGLLAQYHEIDRRVEHELIPFSCGLSRVPGLGRESCAELASLVG